MSRRWPAEIRTLAGELSATGIDAAEIRRRLMDGTAGYPEKLPISYRVVREYVKAWELEHGPAEMLIAEDPSADSFARLRHRLAQRLAAEVHQLERRRAGQLTLRDIAKVRSIERALAEFERKQAVKERRSSAEVKAKRQSQESASVLDQLREREAEQSGRPGITTPKETDPLRGSAERPS